MIGRYQLPVYSPLSLRALAGGLGATLSGGRGARSRISSWIRHRFGARQVQLTDSGTTALALALQAAARRSPGKPMLLPAYSCYDLVTAAMAAGVEVRWYDVEAATLQPDVGSHPAAAAIVVVHHYGIPADLARLRGLGNNLGGALLIEDAAQAIGGRLEGRPLGGFGDFGVLSFGRGKGLTGGGGGALLVNSAEAGQLLDEVRASLGTAWSGLSGLVSTGAQWLLARPALYRVPASLPFLQLGTTVFRAPHPPRAMSPAQSGVLARTLAMEEAETDARGWHAARFQDAAKAWAIPVPAGARPGYLRFPLLLPEALAGLRETPAARRLGIMPGYPVSLPLLPGSPFPPATMPGASALAARLVTLPVHSRLRERDLVGIERLLETWASTDSLR